MVNLMPYTLSKSLKAYSALAFRLFDFPFSIIILGNFTFIQDICCFPLIPDGETTTTFILTLLVLYVTRTFR